MIDVLRVGHIIVCGHYGCGGVQAALGAATGRLFDRWINPIRRLRDAHAAEFDGLADDSERWRRLCELNVAAQVESVRATDVVAAAWARGQSLVVHGWIYDLHDGLLRDLDLSKSGPSS